MFCVPYANVAVTIRRSLVSVLGNEYEGTAGIVDNPGNWGVGSGSATASRPVGLGVTFTGGGLLILLRSKHKIGKTTHDAEVVIGFHICVYGIRVCKHNCRVIGVLHDSQHLIGCI